MPYSSLWGNITGADIKKKVPVQQANVLGRIGNYTIVFPYGLYADLPVGTYLKEIGSGAVIPVTVDRPSDTEQNEPVFFHPFTNTRIIPRNNGDLDIFCVAGEEKGNVNISCKQANIIADESVTITAPLTTVDGNFVVTGDTALGAVVTSNGVNISDTHFHDDSGTYTAGPTAVTGTSGTPV